MERPARRWRSSWSTERGRGAFLVFVLLAMAAAAVACVGLYGRNLPLAEDWHLVAPLTGTEPDFTGWLWAQNNEHRVPLPRLVYLGLLLLAGGDFRAGMVYNVAVLTLLSGLLMLAARRLRGGRSHVADAVFPLLFLHLGHWPNIVWGWQLQFVTAVALTVGLLLVLLRPRPLSGPAALAAGGCLVLLPLCGANGIVYVLALAPWFAYEGLALGRSGGVSAAQRRSGWALLSLAAAAVALVGAYFVGYERATWNPPPPSVGATLKTSAAYVSMGFGPAAQRQWTVAVLGAMAVLVPTALLLVRAVVRQRGPERQRALGLTFFAAGCAALALAIGWGRSGLVPEVGLPSRYALLSAPTFAAAYFVWVCYGPARFRGMVLALLFVVSLALVPLNTRIGFGWRDWYVGGMEAVERDVRAGLPIPLLAERHRAFLLHWDQAKLEAGMYMLRAAGLGPFAAPAAPPESEPSPEADTR